MTATGTLAPGTKVGAHEVIGLIGRGGMGEVYRARDLKLHRDVALKVLPADVAADRDRLARFQREAQILASLNHPHIAAIYELAETGETKALVLELVNGPTLADRIARGPIPLDDVRLIARQIALALEAAHEQGIVHRDLKPANIKVRDDGMVKVLDFGLAKTREAFGTVADLSQSPTISAPAVTQAGVLLGTVAYMSPEQARGDAADTRSDIWAFGCVLYEMLAGKPAFGGKHLADVLGAIVHVEPDWSALPDTVPTTMRWVLKRCLQKDPMLRLRDIADVRALIEDAPADAVSTATPTRRRSLASYAGWIAAAVAVAVAAALVVSPVGQRGAPAPPEARLQILTPRSDDPYSLALAPDGRSIVLQARVGERAMLMLRRLESLETRVLAGTEGGFYPFWSPDSQSLGFFTPGALKRIDIGSGFVRTLAAAEIPRRADWNQNSTIIFGSGVGPLRRVSADGGAVTDVTSLSSGQTNHRVPQFLPGGSRFLFYTLGLRESRGLYLGSLTDKAIRRVSDRDAAYALLPPSHILIVKDGALWARRLNVDAAGVEGELLPVAPQVLASGNPTGFAAFSVSATGLIAYRASNGTRQLTWLDRAGRPAGALGQPDPVPSGTQVRVSPDGEAVGVTRQIDGNEDVWILDARRGAFRRLTSDPGSDSAPVFSPDGRRVAYVADGKADVWDIFVRSTDGTGVEAPVLSTGENKVTRDWSPDGRYLLYENQSPKTSTDLWAVPLEGERTPVPIARTKAAEGDGHFSADGHWVAFVSDQSGQSEVYVQRFPDAGPALQVSVGGARNPRWRRDGRELFYVSADNHVIATPVAFEGSKIVTGRAESLFTLPERIRSGCEPSPDGQRFLVATVVADPSPITIILNWKPPRK